MKNLHRIRISIAASALVLTAMSSNASAQPTREEYCNQVAWGLLLVARRSPHDTDL